MMSYEHDRQRKQEEQTSKRFFKCRRERRRRTNEQTIFWWRCDFIFHMYEKTIQTLSRTTTKNKRANDFVVILRFHYPFGKKKNQSITSWGVRYPGSNLGFPTGDEQQLQPWRHVGGMGVPSPIGQPQNVYRQKQILQEAKIPKRQPNGRPRHPKTFFCRIDVDGENRKPTTKLQRLSLYNTRARPSIIAQWANCLSMARQDSPYWSH